MDDLNPITRTERLLDGEDLTPTNREEMFIKRIYDKTQEIPEPVNRKEYFLKKAGEAGGDVTVVPLSVTDNGTYSEAGKAYSPVTVEVEPPANSYQLKSITTPTSLATFEASVMPMPSLKVSVEAKQAGSGTPSPENVRPIIGWDEANVSNHGKNVLPLVLEDIKSINTSGTWNDNVYTLNDITWTVEIADGVINGITASGTSRIGSAIYLVNDFTYNQGVIMSGCPSGGASNKYNINWVNNGDDIGEGVTINEPTAGNVRIRIVNNVTVSNLLFKPMIRPSSVSDATYEPYINQTTTISLGQTVYGGELDVVNGGGSSKFGLVDLSTLPWEYNADYNRFQASFSGYKRPASNSEPFNAICSCFSVISSNGTASHSGNYGIGANAGSNILVARDEDYTSAADFIASLTGQTLCYELATPTAFETQPTPIKSLNGINNLSVDSGEVIEGEYFKALGGE